MSSNGTNLPMELQEGAYLDINCMLKRLKHSLIHAELGFIKNLCNSSTESQNEKKKKILLSSTRYMYN